MPSTSSPKLYDHLSDFLKRYGFTFPFPERFSYFLCSVLRQDYGYVAMSPEELLLRGHLQTHGDLAISKSVNVFKHKDLFNKMGLTDKQFEVALNNCIMAGVLKKDSESDGQAEFRTTVWVDLSISLEHALFLLNGS